MDPETSVEVVTPKIEILDPVQSRTRKFLKLAFQTKWAILTIFVTAIASGGSFYIALHPELIWEAMNYPYAIAFLAAIPVTVFALGLVINFSTAIRGYVHIQLERYREDKRSLWFEFVIICFIAVSMIEAGPFFAALIKNDFFGYFTIFAIDVTAVQFMQSRKKALIHSDSKKAFLYMVGVVVTALPSMFGNVYNSILNFNLATTHEPLWMVGIAPTVGVIFPTLIIFLAYTVDADINKKGIVDRYTDTENIRIQLLEAQERSLTRQAEIRERLALLQQRKSLFSNIFFTQNKLLLVRDMVVTHLQPQVDMQVQQCIDTSFEKMMTEKTQHHSKEMQQLKQEMYQLPERVLAQQKELALKIQEVDALLQELIELRENVPGLIDARVQELQPELIAQQVFLKMIPGVKEDVQKQITAAIPPQTTITEVTHSEEPSSNEWNVAKVKAKQVGFTMKNPIATIQEFTFATFAEAANWMEDEKLTTELLKKAYAEHLIPSKYFRIIITEAFGKQGEHPVILLHPGVKKLLLKVK